jgi:hypothetical protein
MVKNERIFELSKFSFLLVIVLYILGFITISSFLGRFGFVNFDIVNARYIVAGVFPLAMLTLAIIFAWFLYTRDDFDKAKICKKQVERFIYFYFFPPILWVISVLLVNVLTFVKDKPAQNAYNIKFTPFFISFLFKNDFIGNFVGKINFSKESIFLNCVLKNFFYYSSWLLIIVGLFCLIIYLLRFFKKKEPASGKVENIKKVEVKDAVTDIVNEHKKIGVFSGGLFWFLLIDIIIYYVIIGIFSFRKIYTELFDFNNVSNFELTSGAIFAWLFSTSLMFFILFFTLKVPKKKISKDYFFSLFKSMGNINGVTIGIQWMLLPLISSLVFFGWVIFPRIPFSIGGGEPRKIELSTKIEIVPNFETLYLVGESNSEIFVVGKNKAKITSLQINKSEISLIKINSN